jgi:hypothetical protein
MSTGALLDTGAAAAQDAKQHENKESAASSRADTEQGDAEDTDAHNTGQGFSGGQMDIVSLASTPVDVGSSAPATPGDRDLVTPAGREESVSSVSAQDVDNGASSFANLARSLQSSLNSPCPATSGPLDLSSALSDAYNGAREPARMPSAFMPVFPFAERQNKESASVPGTYLDSNSPYVPRTSSATYLSPTPVPGNGSLPSADTLVPAGPPSAKTALLTPATQQYAPTASPAKTPTQSPQTHDPNDELRNAAQSKKSTHHSTQQSDDAKKTGSESPSQPSMGHAQGSAHAERTSLFAPQYVQGAKLSDDARIMEVHNKSHDG